MISNLLIIGSGLIGASFARGLRASATDAHAVVHVVMFDANVSEAALAVQLGFADAVAESIEIAALHADFIFIATPVRTITPILAKLAAHISEHCVITDAGSTKAQLVQQARAALGPKFCQYVPGHPIAGRETSGVVSSDPKLFAGKNIVLTPLHDTAKSALARVSAAWVACGAYVQIMSPADHDATFAAVSHLPHLLAFALVDELAGRKDAARLFGFAASGFRDFTRIAASSPDMWRDITLQNKSALQAELTAYQLKISALQAILNQPEAAASADIHAMMSRAQSVRKEWQAGQYIEANTVITE
jgi:prephenate dehydrogenase